MSRDIFRWFLTSQVIPSQICGGPLADNLGPRRGRIGSVEAIIRPDILAYHETWLEESKNILSAE